MQTGQRSRAQGRVRPPHPHPLSHCPVLGQVSARLACREQAWGKGARFSPNVAVASLRLAVTWASWQHPTSQAAEKQLQSHPEQDLKSVPFCSAPEVPPSPPPSLLPLPLSSALSSRREGKG